MKKENKNFIYSLRFSAEESQISDASKERILNDVIKFQVPWKKTIKFSFRNSTLKLAARVTTSLILVLTVGVVLLNSLGPGPQSIPQDAKDLLFSLIQVDKVSATGGSGVDLSPVLQNISELGNYEQGIMRTITISYTGAENKVDCLVAIGEEGLSIFDPNDPDANTKTTYISYSGKDGYLDLSYGRNKENEVSYIFYRDSIKDETVTYAGGKYAARVEYPLADVNDSFEPNAGNESTVIEDQYELSQGGDYLYAKSKVNHYCGNGKYIASRYVLDLKTKTLQHEYYEESISKDNLIGKSEITVDSAESDYQSVFDRVAIDSFLSKNQISTREFDDLKYAGNETIGTTGGASRESVSNYLANNSVDYLLPRERGYYLNQLMVFDSTMLKEPDFEEDLPSYYSDPDFYHSFERYVEFKNNYESNFPKKENVEDMYLEFQSSESSSNYSITLKIVQNGKDISKLANGFSFLTKDSIDEFAENNLELVQNVEVRIDGVAEFYDMYLYQEVMPTLTNEVSRYVVLIGDISKDFKGIFITPLNTYTDDDKAVQDEIDAAAEMYSGLSFDKYNTESDFQLNESLINQAKLW